ncbi:hypothetical protein QTP88_015476 [Uroleucon formosanum]
MIAILQINLNCCKVAQALMHQMVTEKSADFLIVSEYNKVDSNWHVDANNKAAIVNAKHAVITSTGTSEAGFRWISITGIRIYSCDWSPNTSLADFQDFFFRLERSIRLSTEDILLVGDFNVKYADWGSKTNYRRGKALSDMIHALGLLVYNKGNDPTFKTGSIIGVTFSSPGVAGSIVQASKSLRYLGVQIDSKLGFSEHAINASAKASIASQKLSRIMPNISAATARKRRLLGNVVHSLLLFGVPIWADCMCAKGTAEIAKVERKTAFRLTSAYCTVSTNVALVVVSMPPIDVLAKERLFIYTNKDDQVARGKTRDGTLESWQTRCDKPGPGRWTHRLIPSIAQWLNRKLGDVDFQLTQFFTGYGCFPEYLQRFGKLDSPECWYCGHDVDDVLNTIFDCDAWEIKRTRVNIMCGTTVTPENITKSCSKARVPGTQSQPSFTKSLRKRRTKRDGDKRLKSIKFS